MKSVFMALTMLATLGTAHAAIIGCTYENEQAFEKLTEENKVTLSVTQPIEVEKGDYKSGDNFELWMKDKSDKARTIKANQPELVKSMELLGDENNPDTLIFQFGANTSGVDTFAFTSRDEDSVIKKLKDSKILTLNCSPKK